MAVQESEPKIVDLVLLPLLVLLHLLGHHLLLDQASAAY